LARKKKITLPDLEGQRLILPPSNRPHRMAINQALLDKNVNWEIAIEANGWELMIHFVNMGMGLTIVNSCCNISKKLMAIPIYDLPKQHYYIIRRKSDWERPMIKALCGILLKHGNDWKKQKE
jgi:DNA-binding transcriptional LysR family regulator